MKRIPLYLLFLLCALPAHAFEEPEADRKPQTDTLASSAKRKEDRFLPMRKRFDRHIEGYKFAYKGETMLGLTASYATLSSDDTDLMLILDEIRADGSVLSVNPFVGFFYRDNRCFGIRFGYRRIDGELGNLTLNLGAQNDIDLSVNSVDLKSESLSVAFFHRSYTGLDSKGRFGLFSELELSLGKGSSHFSYDPGDGQIKTTQSRNLKAKLAFNPGAAVYIFPNVCGTLSFGLGGIEYGKVLQDDAEGNRIGSRTTSKMRFRFNLADIRIGMVIHLWNKHKQ